MLFAEAANVSASEILERMRILGFDTAPSWKPNKIFLPYYGYWNIAPTKGWSGGPLVRAVISFILAAAFLISCAPRLPR
jgi:hypothetical protein